VSRQGTKSAAATTPLDGRRAVVSLGSGSDESSEMKPSGKRQSFFGNFKLSREDGGSVSGGLEDSSDHARLEMVDENEPVLASKGKDIFSMGEKALGEQESAQKDSSVVDGGLHGTPSSAVPGGHSPQNRPHVSWGWLSANEPGPKHSSK
jgi:hypothetical protein